MTFPKTYEPIPKGKNVFISRPYIPTSRKQGIPDAQKREKTQIRYYDEFMRITNGGVKLE